MSPVRFERKSGLSPEQLQTAIANGLRSAIDEATKAGAAEAREVIVSNRRVKTGKMRDANRSVPATQQGNIITGSFINDTPYAIYHEMGTIKISPIRFMQYGKIKALQVLRKRIANLIGGKK
jgi:hypothetical protein